MEHFLKGNAPLLDHLLILRSDDIIRMLEQNG